MERLTTTIELILLLCFLRYTTLQHLFETGSMPLLNILQFPDPRLKLKAETVTTIDTEIMTLVDNMFETMYEAVGVGLAATQVNIQKRIITIDVSEDRRHPLCLINPEILVRKGSLIWEEGCLSFPGVYAKVNRASEIEISYLDNNGEQHLLKADGLLCVCIQHEIDHLDGITFYDHLSPLKQQLMRKKLEKNRRRAL